MLLPPASSAPACAAASIPAASPLVTTNPRVARVAAKSRAVSSPPALAWRLPSLEGRSGVEAVAVAFREDFRGDRVAALVGGLGGMLHAAFDGKTEFFVLDDVDPQKLHNSARNLEIAVWKLANSRDAQGNLLLLTNEMQPLQNLSFEREFGKMIGHLDLLSTIVADKTNRTIVKMVQNLATALFIPVPGVK